MSNRRVGRFRLYLTATFVAAGTTACSGVEETAGSSAASTGYDMGNGIASYYDDHNQMTAYGEIFDQWAYTAAMVDVSYKNARICVTNLNNKRQVEVRINDRGPWGTGAIIDLSTAAMQAVGGISAGRIPVNLYVLGKGESCGYRGPTPEEIEKMCARKFVHKIEGSDRDATLRVTADISCPATKVVVTFNGKGLDSKTFEGVVKESHATKTISARFRLADIVAAGYTSAKIALSKNKTAYYTLKQAVTLPRSEPPARPNPDEGTVEAKPLPQPPPLPPLPPAPLPEESDADGPVRLDTPNGVIEFPPLREPPPL